MKEYLGDAVYAEYNKEVDHITLFTSNGIEALDTIIIDNDVLTSFMLFLHTIGKLKNG
jgi:hypothetical protein